MTKIVYLDLFESFQKTVLQGHTGENANLNKVYASVLNQFLEHFDKKMLDPVGTELLDAVQLGLFLDSLEDRYQKETIAPMKSKIRKIRDHYIRISLDLNVADASYSAALDYLVKIRHDDIQQLAKEIGISFATLYRWVAGTSLPEQANLPAVEKLEDHYGLPRSTLKNKLGKLIFGAKGKRELEMKKTKYGEAITELMKLPYGFPFAKWPTRVQDDLLALKEFFTSPMPTGKHAGFKKNRFQKWKDDGKNCSSFNRYKQQLEHIFGFIVHEQEILPKCLSK